MKVEKIFKSKFACTEERIRGGGSLNLTKHVASILGLNENQITGA